MKGIVLAGGTGSRLWPLTKVTNKHLLPVGNEPMIFHPIKKLLEAGIHDILIVTGTEHMGDVVGLLGSGKEFNCEFTYRVQDQAGGIAQALGLARNFVGNERMVVILGDNIFEDSIARFIELFSEQPNGARILLKEVNDPQRYGVAVFDENNYTITGIQEKPDKPKSNCAVTGIYAYDSSVFDIIRDLKPSSRNEIEITDVNNEYIARQQMKFSSLLGWWTDAGTHESLRLASKLIGG